MRGGRTLEVGNFGMKVCIHIIIIRFNEASSSKRDFATVACSAVGHIPLSSWYMVYQLQSTEFPSLQGFPQTLSAGSPHCFSLHSIPLGRCVCVWNAIMDSSHGFKSWQQHSIQGVATVIYPVNPVIYPVSNSCTVITPVKMLI